MLRRISGSSFALAMIVIIAMKHAALGFCLCQEQLIISTCACDCEVAPVSESCGCCPEEAAQTEKEPCRDCLIPLDLDPGDFVWSAHTFSPAEQDGTAIILPTGMENSLFAAQTNLVSDGAIRGSPPPAALPVYLRTCVLRL